MSCSFTGLKNKEKERLLRPMVIFPHGAGNLKK